MHWRILRVRRKGKGYVWTQEYFVNGVKMSVNEYLTRRLRLVAEAEACLMGVVR